MDFGPELGAVYTPLRPRMCVYVALNRNQTAMPPPPPPPTSSVTTPGRDNEDLLTLCHKPADTKRTASPDPSPEQAEA